MKKVAARLVFAGILLKSCSGQGIDLPCANEVVQASEGALKKAPKRVVPS
jgi:hypothetical protein